MRFVHWGGTREPLPPISPPSPNSNRVILSEAEGGVEGGVEESRRSTRHPRRTQLPATTSSHCAPSLHRVILSEAQRSRRIQTLPTSPIPPKSFRCANARGDPVNPSSSPSWTRKNVHKFTRTPQTIGRLAHHRIQNLFLIPTIRSSVQSVLSFSPERSRRIQTNPSAAPTPPQASAVRPSYGLIPIHALSTSSP